MEHITLERYLDAGHSNLPIPAEVAYLKETKQWLLISELTDSNRLHAADCEYSFVLQRVKGLRKCRRCGYEICQLSFGYFTIDPKKQCGITPVWLHPHCIPLPLFGVTSLEALFIKCRGFHKRRQLTKAKLLSTVLEDPEKLNVFDLKSFVKQVLTERLPVPAELKAELLPFQAEGYAWMVNQELSKYRGSILADEMGMGKTIQAITLMLGRRVGTTLIVVPFSSVTQWFNEIETFAPSLKVLVYHTSSKVAVSQLNCYDIVITTYQTLECNYRMQVKPKVCCCDKYYTPAQLAVHQQLNCQKVIEIESTLPTWKPKKLIKFKPVSIKSISKEWSQTPKKPKPSRVSDQVRDDMKRNTPLVSKEVVSATPKKRKIIETTPSSRPRRVIVKKKFDDYVTLDSDDDSVIDENSVSDESEFISSDEEGITSPDESNHEDDEEDYEEDSIGKESPLHSIKWARVILDEAHRIKERTNSTASSTFALESDFRWCITATPMQNKVSDLYALLRFLRIEPFAYYHCKVDGCACQSLDHIFVDNKYCIHCHHSKTLHFSYFKKLISDPITFYATVGVGGDAFRTLKTQVMDKIILRRTKVERACDVRLPPLTVTQVTRSFSRDESVLYARIFNQAQVDLNQFRSRDDLNYNYAHIFVILNRLRQACDHPSLPNFDWSNERCDPTTCAVCHDDINVTESRGVAACGHLFHRVCAEQYMAEAPFLTFGSGSRGCPWCFEPLTLTFQEADDDTTRECTPVPSTSPLPSGVNNSTFKTSTKLDMLADEIKGIDKEEKIIVFSQYTRMLELAAFRLKQDDIECATLTGAQNMIQRGNIIASFNFDTNLRVLLISLKAGGEGLNLQIANNVILLDPWWNPAAELQAIQRVHRIGQTRSVRAVKLVIDDTIETRIIALQERKHLGFEAIVGQSHSALNKLQHEDLVFLFKS